MKSRLIYTTLFSIITFTLMAQMPVATLEHNGETSVFYGARALLAAYASAVTGDDIILSAGGFIAPVRVEKGLKVIGAGYRQDSSYVGKNTIVTGSFSVQEGASNSHFEGIHFNAPITYSGTLEQVRIKRCRIPALSLSTTASTSFCSIEESIITGDIYLSSNADGFLLKQNIFYSSYNFIRGANGAVIDNNIFIHKPNTDFFNTVNATLFRNNIFLRLSGYHRFIYPAASNSFTNNIFTGDSTFFISPTDIGNNNYFNVPSENIFVFPLEDKDFDTNNFRLQNPELYIGTDGTQVGLYGTTMPFKENKLPSNPIITSATVAPEVDEEGNLKVSFTVEAQDK